VTRKTEEYDNKNVVIEGTFPSAPLRLNEFGAEDASIGQEQSLYRGCLFRLARQTAAWCYNLCQDWGAGYRRFETFEDPICN